MIFLYITKYINLILKKIFYLIQKQPLTALVAPLDWGLGHATRCIKLIKELEQMQCNIFIACNATAKKLLLQEFPNATYLDLHGYNVQYAKRWIALKILQQIPKIHLAIQYERRWLEKIINQHNIDIVFSDNRFGFYNKKLPCIFITHQLQIQAPYKWLQGCMQRINYTYINRFAACWVPDYEGAQNIAGELSHPRLLPTVPVSYIGPLSRFITSAQPQIKYKWLLLLSGPEPQRTLLEDLLLLAFANSNEPVLLVRGLPAAITVLPQLYNHISIVNHLPTTQLQQALSESGFVISRSGYTTVMEVLSLQKKAILIPTPGQTEQEYLGTHLMQQHWCYSFQQHEDIAAHLQKAQSFTYHLPALADTTLHQTLQQFLEATELKIATAKNK